MGSALRLRLSDFRLWRGVDCEDQGIFRADTAKSVFAYIGGADCAGARESALHCLARQRIETEGPDKTYREVPNAIQLVVAEAQRCGLYFAYR